MHAAGKQYYRVLCKVNANNLPFVYRIPHSLLSTMQDVVYWSFSSQQFFLIALITLSVIFPDKWTWVYLYILCWTPIPP